MKEETEFLVKPESYFTFRDQYVLRQDDSLGQRNENNNVMYLKKDIGKELLTIERNLYFDFGVQPKVVQYIFRVTEHDDILFKTELVETLIL